MGCAMSDMQAATLLWRMENMDEGARLTADRRAGLLAHMLRRARGNRAHRGRT
jgi:hypothetical protein